MHAVGDHGGPGVPAFLTKLWTLVEDPSTDELICWDPTGRSFHVYEQARFSKEVLPMYFKHSNIASFIRQLNMYGFRKVVNVEAGGLKTERDDMEFAHQCFVRDQENLLEYIKRKVPSGKADEVKLKPGDLTHVLTDVHDLKDKQSSMTNKIGALKVENEALWREVATLRNKHHKQQQIVNKLIQFLVSLVGNRGISSRKRSMPLMIDDAPNSKAPKLAGQNTREEVPKTATSTETEDKSGGCLTIHDITDLPDVSGGTGDANNIQAFAQQQNINMADLVSGMAQVPDESVQQASVPEVPVDIISLIDAIPSQGASNVGLDLTSLVTQESSAASTSAATSAATYSAPPTSDPQSSVAVAVPSGCNRSELGDHVDNLQADLEAIKDLLTAGTYSLDPSQLLELFASEPHNTLPPDIFNVSGQDLSNLESSFPAQGSSGNISGNELIQYTAPTEMGPIFEFDDDLPGGEDSKLNTPHPDLGEVKKELTEEVD